MNIPPLGRSDRFLNIVRRTTGKVLGNLAAKNEVITIDDPNNLAKILSPAILSEFDAFVFVPDVVLSAYKAEVINLISASNKPAIYPMSDFVDSGGFHVIRH